MKKKEELRNKIRRKTKQLFVTSIAALTTASIVLAPISASAQTPHRMTNSILPTSITGLTNPIGGIVTPPPPPPPPPTDIIGGVTGTIEEVIANPPSEEEIIEDPVSAVEDVTDPILNPSVPIDPKTSPVQPPTAVVDQVSDAVTNPSNGEEDVTEIVNGSGPNNSTPSLPTDQTGDSFGGANISLMTKESLSANLQKTNSNQYKLFLDYSGTRAAGITLLGKMYVFFKMPEEFTELLSNEDFKKSIKATYYVPIIGSSGPNAINSGAFEEGAIKLDPATNSIILEYNDVLSLSLNAAAKFSVEIDLKHLPASSDKVYTFFSLAYDKNAIKLDLLESRGAKADVKLPEQSGENPGTAPGSGGGSNPGAGGGDSGSGDGKGAGSDGQGKNNWINNMLPKTATNIWNISLIGAIVTLFGVALKYMRLRRLT